MQCNGRGLQRITEHRGEPRCKSDRRMLPSKRMLVKKVLSIIVLTNYLSSSRKTGHRTWSGVIHNNCCPDRSMDIFVTL